MSNRKRSTFEFDPDTTQLLDDLKGRLHVGTKSDVIRRALKIADVMTKAEADGSKFYIKEPGEDDLARVILV